MDFQNMVNKNEFWIDGRLSYAVNTPGATSPDEEYVVKEVVDLKCYNNVKRLEKKWLKYYRKISFNKKKTLPALIRIDFACCKK